MQRFSKLTGLVVFFLVGSIFAEGHSTDPTAVDRQQMGVQNPDDDFIPLSDLKPLEKGYEHREDHSLQYGLSASNTVINDSRSFPQGYFLGNYRPYMNYYWNEQHSFNARGKFAYKNNPSLTSDQEKSGALASVGQYNFELFNVQLNFDRHRVTVGRNFYRLGRGLLFANFADGAEYTGAFQFFSVKAQALYSGEYGGCMISLGGCATAGDIAQPGLYTIVPGRAADVNLADPGRRFFGAVQVSSPQYYGSSVYALVQYSRDMSRSAATSGTANGKIYAYDPLNLGLGASGYIMTSRLRYFAEFVLQRGQTYNKLTTSNVNDNQQTSINAWGLTADINYSLPWFEKLVKPGLVLQYATGSGRSSSSANPANPSQENTAGADNNFYYFGAYSAGLALKPKLSNLHIIRLGFQMHPLYHYYWGRNFMLSFKYTYYRKVNADYSISDPNATVALPTVGQGLDAQLVWNFRSDLKLYYAYGLFVPSEAYTAANAKNIQAHIVSLNFLF